MLTVHTIHMEPLYLLYVLFIWSHYAYCTYYSYGNMPLCLLYILFIWSHYAYCTYYSYGIMDHFTLNLRPKEYFQLAPNMRTAYIELCIYVISKSVTYRPGRLRTLADRNQPTRFPRPRAKYYIHLVVGQWSKGLPYGSPLCILAYHTYHTGH